MKTKFIFLIFVFILFSTFSNAYMQTIGDHITNDNNNAGQYGVEFYVNSSGYFLQNVSYVDRAGDQHTHACLLNLTDISEIDCVLLTDTGSYLVGTGFNISLVEGVTYIMAGLRNGSSQRTGYGNPASFPYYPTETLDFLWVADACSLGTTFPINPANYADSNFIMDLYSLGIINETVGGGSPPSSSGDYITVTNFTNTSISNNSIGLSWNTQGNYSYSEIRNFTGYLLYNGSPNSTIITGLENNTFYWFNVTVFWNTSLYNHTWTNQSTNQTIQFRFNELWAYNLIIQYEEENNMIWAVLLWLGITFGALHILLTQNQLIGNIMWYLGYTFDFLLVARIYETVTASGGFTGMFYGFMYIGLGIWLLIKWYIPLMITRPKKRIY